MAEEIICRVAHIAKTFSGVTALDDVSPTGLAHGEADQVKLMSMTLEQRSA